MVNPSTHSGQVVSSHLSIRLIVEIGKIVEALFLNPMSHISHPTSTIRNPQFEIRNYSPMLYAILRLAFFLHRWFC